MSEYVPILIMAAIASGVALAFLSISLIAGPRKPNPVKAAPYECGMVPVGDARHRFSIRFYLIAMVFIVFDIEAAFLYPWAVYLRYLKVFGFVEMVIFIAVLLVGYVYLWRKGGFEWD